MYNQQLYLFISSLFYVWNGFIYGNACLLLLTLQFRITSQMLGIVRIVVVHQHCYDSIIVSHMNLLFRWHLDVELNAHHMADFKSNTTVGLCQLINYHEYWQTQTSGFHLVFSALSKETFRWLKMIENITKLVLTGQSTYSTQKGHFCHDLFTLMLFQTFLSSVEQKIIYFIECW